MKLAEYRERLKDPRWYIETFFKVKDKRTGQVIPFRLKPAQADFLGQRTTRDIIGKASSQYISSLIEAMFLHLVLTTPGVTAVTTTQASATIDMAKEHLKLVRFFWESMPDAIPIEDARGGIVQVKPTLGEDSAYKLTFPQIGSEYCTTSAGSVSALKGRPIHLWHATEVPAWTIDEAESIIAYAESRQPFWIVLEGTAVGELGPFRQRFMKAWNYLSEYRAHFYGWWWDKENCYIPERDARALPEDRGLIIPTEEEAQLMLKYNLEIGHIRWRRVQFSKPLAKQEHAEDPVTMFLVAGSPVFDLVWTDRLLPRCREAIITEDSGCLKLWLPPTAEGRYLVWADPSGGNQEGSFSVSVVCKLNPFQHVATLRGRWEAQIHAAKSVQLAKRYNNAVLGWERNNQGLAFGYQVTNFEKYPPIFKYRDPLKPTALAQPGFPVSGSSKSMIKDAFTELLAQDGLATYSHNLVAEIRGWRYVGAEMVPQLGGYDDELMAMMEAYWAKNRMRALEAPGGEIYATGRL